MAGSNPPSGCWRLVEASVTGPTTGGNGVPNVRWPPENPQFSRAEGWWRVRNLPEAWAKRQRSPYRHEFLRKNLQARLPFSVSVDIRIAQGFSHVSTLFRPLATSTRPLNTNCDDFPARSTTYLREIELFACATEFSLFLWLQKVPGEHP